MKLLCLVDGNAVLHRAFHATPPLTTSKGELVNAVFGFTSMLLSSIQQLKPDYVAIAWDMKAPTFRHQAYTQYKATRPEMDSALGDQYQRVHQVIDALNIPEFELAGFEADDIIGTLALLANEHSDLEVVIITGDRDIMQLIRPRIKVLMPRKSLSDIVLYGDSEFIEKYGFKPIQIIDYKALAGDASDNIPGVPGIGDVTATKLIQQFSTLESIYQPKNLATLPARTQKLLAEGAESAKMSLQLATIDTNVPVKLDLDKCVIHDFDQAKASALFTEIEFKSLIPRLPGFKSSENPDTDNAPEPNTTPDKVQDPKIIELDQSVQKVLSKMTAHGVLIDLPYLQELSVNLNQKLKELQKEIFDSVGHEFNLNSPKQLAEVLFDELNLPVIRKTKTGRSTDEETLLELSPAHPAIKNILEYRTLFKLISTYVDALPKYVDDKSRVHSTFNVEGAATGRLSSTNPNLQNIPVGGELGSEIRRCFVAPSDKIILGADYSQIELRVLAHLTNDPNLINAFTSQIDIHRATAAKIFKIKPEEVTKEQRAIGKTMNFATLYGQGPRALGQQLGIEYKLAKAYIDEYFAEFPSVKAWMSQTLESATKTGYVETVLGRRRYIPELKATNRMLRSAGERAAANHPCQGTSADMIKIAMVNIDQKLSEDPVLKKGCQLILQIHDELLFECDPKLQDKAARIIKSEMENALKLKVPVVADLKAGANWADLKAFDLNN
jgi:DNA polymerase I-like protein with 3'-5' exonuclease and polymerase domains/5'-3' exonuclease